MWFGFYGWGQKSIAYNKQTNHKRTTEGIVIVSIVTSGPEISIQIQHTLQPVHPVSDFASALNSISSTSLARLMNASDVLSFRSSVNVFFMLIFKFTLFA